jgi:hypothetical protein
MTTKHFQVNYDIIPASGIITQALAFNVPTLTGIWELSGHTAFTSHFQVDDTNFAMLPIDWAIVRFVGGSGVQNGAVVSGQFVTMYYDANGNQVWENVGPLLTQRPQFTVDNLASDITAQINSWNGSFQRYLSIKVQGSGKLYEARLEVVYAVPDFSAEIADLQARVAALGG